MGDRRDGRAHRRRRRLRLGGGAGAVAGLEIEGADGHDHRQDRVIVDRDSSVSPVRRSELTWFAGAWPTAAVGAEPAIDPGAAALTGAAALAGAVER